MEITWGTIVFIALAAIITWFWQDSLRVRDRANTAAIEACTRLALQFLDGTVAFTHLRLVRDAGQLRLRRTYVFDYTAHSIERLQGFVIVLGMRVESVGFARDESQRAPPSAIGIDSTAPSSRTSSPISGSPDTASGKILDLDDWRRGRDQHH